MIPDVKKNAEQKMKKTVETLKADLAKIRTSRAHTGLLDHIVVDYYGTPTPFPQVANVTLLEPAVTGPLGVLQLRYGPAPGAPRTGEMGPEG